MNSESSQQLTADLKAVVTDAEALLKATAGEAGSKISGVREKLEETLKVTRARVAEMEDRLIEQTKAAAKATDEYVHENPWQSVGVAAVVGLLLGVLIARK